ncbi:MAG TPA: hypothetical protein VLB76_29940 [Thermoanaerobaculia bacterium]|jgi:hypothetical protein|nr:hypothetical protein [Thermoanaerobaculia bacterium]
MKQRFPQNLSILRWPLAVGLLWLASPAQIYGEEPPIDEAAVRALLEAKDLKSLDRLSAKLSKEDAALGAIYRTRRLTLNNTYKEELRFLDALPDSAPKLWRVYHLTYPSPSGLGEDSRIGDVVYGMFERAARLAQKHGSGHRRVLQICLFSDGELAETAWEWCDWLLKADPERSLRSIQSLPVEDQRRMCGDVSIKGLTAREVVEKCSVDL